MRAPDSKTAALQRSTDTFSECKPFCTQITFSP